MTDARLSLLCKACGANVPLFNLSDEFYLTSQPDILEAFMNDHARGVDCDGAGARLAIPGFADTRYRQHDLEPCVEIVGLWGRPGWNHPDQEYRPMPWADLRAEVEREMKERA